MSRLLPSSSLFPYTTLFRSLKRHPDIQAVVPQRFLLFARRRSEHAADLRRAGKEQRRLTADDIEMLFLRSEEHTSELQSPCNLVCRLLLEKKNRINSLSAVY